MRTILSSSTARARAALVPSRWWIVSASMSWLSTVYTGSRHVAGSWKIMAISRPRIDRSWRSGSPTSWRPLNSIEPAAMRPVDSSRPRMDSAVTLLPEPDSPTSATVSPRSMWNDTSLTASTSPRRVAKRVRRPRTSSTTSGTCTPSWLTSSSVNDVSRTDSSL